MNYGRFGLLTAYFHCFCDNCIIKIKCCSHQSLHAYVSSHNICISKGKSKFLVAFQFSFPSGHWEILTVYILRGLAKCFFCTLGDAANGPVVTGPPIGNKIQKGAGGPCLLAKICYGSGTKCVLRRSIAHCAGMEIIFQFRHRLIDTFLQLNYV